MKDFMALPITNVFYIRDIAQKYFFNQLNAKKMAEASKKTLTEAECEYIALFIR